MKKFNELEEYIASKNFSIKKIAVVSAADVNTLKSLERINSITNAIPILIGDRKIIEELIEINKIKINNYEIIEAVNDEEAANIGVELVRKNEANILMKGLLQTSDFLRPVVNKERGIVKNSLLSHVALNEIPSLSRMFIVSDGGMVLYPSKEERKQIIENASMVAKKMGINIPRIALLDAAEHTNKKIKVSLESEEITNENINGFLSDTIIEGPISLDLAIDPKIAKAKKYQGRIKGDADILIVPDIISGNILGKSMILFGNSQMAGIVVGAKVPIVLPSRGAGISERINSLYIAYLMD